jgi:hypothetical protein
MDLAWFRVGFLAAAPSGSLPCHANSKLSLSAMSSEDVGKVEDFPEGEDGSATPITPITPITPAVVDKMALDDDFDEEFEDEIAAGEDMDAEITIPEWSEDAPIEVQMLDLAYSAIRIQNCDFLSEFGAAEPFLVDGESLVAFALSNALLDCSSGGQTLHITHIVEATLSNLAIRGACFDVFFFEGYAPLWRQQGDLACMTREIIIKHLSLCAAHAKICGKPITTRVHFLPGGWWQQEADSAWSKLLEAFGPAYIMTDYGWCGAQGDATLAVTRGFVHHVHAHYLNVVTIADLQIDGSHSASYNMQPPKQPLARVRFMQGNKLLLDKYAGVLSSTENLPTNVVIESAPGTNDSRELLCTAALKKALNAGGGKHAQDFAAVFCLATALSQSVPLSERLFPLSKEALQVWCLRVYCVFMRVLRV